MLPGIIKGAKYLETMANHTNHLMDLQKERHEKEMFFTQDALSELQSLSEILNKMYDRTCANLNHYSEADFEEIKSLHSSMDQKIESYSIRHVHRLENEECTLDASLIYLEMLSTIDRISDYLYKIQRLCRYELKGIPAPID